MQQHNEAEGSPAANDADDMALYYRLFLKGHVDLSLSQWLDCTNPSSHTTDNTTSSTRIERNDDDSAHVLPEEQRQTIRTQRLVDAARDLLPSPMPTLHGLNPPPPMPTLQALNQDQKSPNSTPLPVVPGGMDAESGLIFVGDVLRLVDGVDVTKTTMQEFEELLLGEDSTTATLSFGKPASTTSALVHVAVNRGPKGMSSESSLSSMPPPRPSTPEQAAAHDAGQLPGAGLDMQQHNEAEGRKGALVDIMTIQTMCVPATSAINLIRRHYDTLHQMALPEPQFADAESVVVSASQTPGVNAENIESQDQTDTGSLEELLLNQEEQYKLLQQQMETIEEQRQTIRTQRLELEQGQQQGQDLVQQLETQEAQHRSIVAQHEEDLKTTVSELQDLLSLQKEQCKLLQQQMETIEEQRQTILTQSLELEQAQQQLEDMEQRLQAQEVQHRRIVDQLEDDLKNTISEQQDLLSLQKEQCELLHKQEGIIEQQRQAIRTHRLELEQRLQERQQLEQQLETLESQHRLIVAQLEEDLKNTVPELQELIERQSQEIKRLQQQQIAEVTKVAGSAADTQAMILRQSQQISRQHDTIEEMETEIAFLRENQQSEMKKTRSRDHTLLLDALQEAQKELITLRTRAAEDAAEIGSLKGKVESKQQETEQLRGHLKSATLANQELTDYCLDLKVPLDISPLLREYFVGAFDEIVD